jgi:DNA polymerase-3 subunit epsilon
MSVREFKGKHLIAFPDDYVILDIETTGFNPKNCDIIEVGAVKVSQDKIVSIFQSLVKPLNPINNYITRLTGLTNQMLNNAQSIENILDALNAFIGESILIGHNINSDINFLYDHCERYLHYPLTNDYIDIRDLFKSRQHSVLSPKLTEVCEKCAIQNTNAHRALSDCLSAYNLYQSLKSHSGSFSCIEELNTLNLASEFKLAGSPYRRQCQHHQPSERLVSQSR